MQSQSSTPVPSTQIPTGVNIQSMLAAQTPPVSKPVEQKYNELQEIDFNLSVDVFNQQVFKALESRRGFILTNMGKDFSQTTEQLFQAYDDFRAHPESKQAEFKGNEKTLEGYFPDGSFLNGSKLGPRFFISRDATKKLTHSLPVSHHPHVSMQAADDKLLPFTDQIVAKTIAAIESGLKLQANEFSSVFSGYQIKTAIHHYLPITQNKLLNWSAQKQLTKTEDGRIEAFLNHKDLVPMTILVYRHNKADGLELKLKDETGKKTYYPVQLSKSGQDDDMRAIVILGRVIEHLTSGVLKGLNHRVIVKPMSNKGDTFSRDGINIFILLGPEVVIKPVVSGSTQPEANPLTMNQNQFFEFYGSSYKKNAENAAVDVSAQELAAYPKDEEILSNKTDAGTSYTRK